MAKPSESAKRSRADSRSPRECVCILCLCCSDHLIGLSFGREEQQRLSARLLECTMVPELALRCMGPLLGIMGMNCGSQWSPGTGYRHPNKRARVSTSYGQEAPSLPFLCPQLSRFEKVKLVGQAEVPRISLVESALESQLWWLECPDLHLFSSEARSRWSSMPSHAPSTICAAKSFLLLSPRSAYLPGY